MSTKSETFYRDPFHLNWQENLKTIPSKEVSNVECMPRNREHYEIICYFLEEPDERQYSDSEFSQLTHEWTWVIAA